MAKGLNRKQRGQRRNLMIYDACLVEKQPKKYLEKKITRYVIASPDTGNYLVKTGFGDTPSYMFSKNIIKATKTLGALDAKYVIEGYHKDTGDNMDLVVIPLEISYELINETYDSEITQEELLKEILFERDKIDSGQLPS